MFGHLCEYTKARRTVYFKWVDLMVCELYLIVKMDYKKKKCIKSLDGYRIHFKDPRAGGEHTVTYAKTPPTMP